MSAPLALPPEVAAAFPNATAESAWVGHPQGHVWRLSEEGRPDLYVKLLGSGLYPNLTDERERLVWAAERLPVPGVLDHGEADGIEWLVLSALPGRDATHPDLIADPSRTVSILGRGLRAFHETPIDDCPFDFRLDAALEHGRKRVEGDGVPKSKGDFHQTNLHLSPLQALEVLIETRPEPEDVVLCHGDYCFPNILIDEGEATGYLDLGEMGIADRWWDLGVATWSCDWNVGPGFQDLFLDSYGIERDDERLSYYRLMYDLSS